MNESPRVIHKFPNLLLVIIMTMCFGNGYVSITIAYLVLHGLVQLRLNKEAATAVKRV